MAKKKKTWIDNAVQGIFDDFNDRRDLHLDGLDDEIQDEIRKRLREIIREAHYSRSEPCDGA